MWRKCCPWKRKRITLGPQRETEKAHFQELPFPMVKGVGSILYKTGLRSLLNPKSVKPCESSTDWSRAHRIFLWGVLERFSNVLPRKTMEFDPHPLLVPLRDIDRLPSDEGYQWFQGSEHESCGSSTGWSRAHRIFLWGVLERFSNVLPRKIMKFDPHPLLVPLWHWLKSSLKLILSFREDFAENHYMNRAKAPQVDPEHIEYFCEVF